MEIEFTLDARDDLQYWKRKKNHIVLNKIRKLIESISKDPFKGVGQPELLKYDLAGYWSRRILV